MTMTMPVATTNLGEMRFYLTDKSIPEPDEDQNIEIVEIPAARLAVRKFTGFVTDGEVARQKDTLLQALEMDGVELDVDHGEVVPYAVLQYNPPYTLPIVRRNEIAVPVKRSEDLEGEINLKEEWKADAEDGEEAAETEPSDGQDDVSPSDY